MSKLRSVDTTPYPYKNPKNKRQRVLNKTNGHCYYCQTKLLYGKGRDEQATNVYEMDHLIPRCRGGGSVGDDNFVPSCKSCNRRKHDMTVLEWKKHLEEKEKALKEKLDYIQSVLKNLKNITPVEGIDG